MICYNVLVVANTRTNKQETKQNERETTTKFMVFGEYIKQKRQEKGITLRGLADKLDIAPSYMSDIEKGKRNAPNQDTLNKMIEVLELTKEESNELLDLAATSKDAIAQDLTEYVSNNPNVRVALRRAKDLKLGDDEWIKIIEEIINRK